MKNEQKSKFINRSKDLRTVQQPSYYDSKDYDKKKKKKKTKSCQELREERAQKRAIKKEQLETVHLRLPPERAKEILDDINRRLISSSWRPPDLARPSTSYAHHDLVIDHSPLNEVKDDPESDPLTLDEPVQPVDDKPNDYNDDEVLIFIKTHDVTSLENTSNFTRINLHENLDLSPLKQSEESQFDDVAESNNVQPVSDLDNHEKFIVNMTEESITLLSEEPVAEIVEAAATL